MKDWIPLFQTLIWPGFTLILIKIFLPQLREFFGAIAKRVASGSSLKIGKDGLTLGEDLRDSDKVSEEKKNKVATELAQKREEDYVYGDWHNAAVIAYSEKRYEATLRDLSQALQYAKTKEQTATALFNQGVVLMKLGRFEETLQVCKQVDERYGKDIEPGVRKQVASALVVQGVVLVELGRSEKALQVYKQVDERYGKDTEPGVREPVASALFNQGFVLGKLNHPQDALQVYKQVDTRYGKDTEPGVREQVAKALVNQGVVLGKLGSFEDALQVSKQVDERYGKDAEPGFRESVARSLGNQGFVLRQLGRSEEAIVALRKAEVIFAALGMTEDEQQVRKLIAAIEKEKISK